MAESAIVHAAIKLAVGVYKPLTDGERNWAEDYAFDARLKGLLGP